MTSSVRTYLAINVNKITTALLSFLGGLLCPITELLFFAGFMILTDTITGIWAAKKRGELISSKKMKQAVPKLILYPLMIIVSAWAEKILPGIPFIKGAATLLIVIEGKSLLENANDILGYNLLKLVKLWISGDRAELTRFWNDINKQKQQQ